MKLPREITGRQLAAALVRSWGYRRVHQVGSHVVLETDAPSHHRISIPDHVPLRVGTLNAVLRAVAAHLGTTREALLESC